MKKAKAAREAELSKFFKPKILEASKSMIESRGSSPNLERPMPSFE